ncbi:MAG: lysophospholipid acyltransferase family protein [Thermodesulfobacteriota bacterium]
MTPVFNALKIVWLLFWLTFNTLVIFFPVVLAAMLGKTGNLAFSITRLWAMGILFVTGTRTSVRGQENIEKGRSYIIISNHQSHFDILAIVVRLGIQYRWIIKREIRKVPLFGYALHASRNIFIDRSNRESAIRSINDGVDRLPPGVGVLFFAEGTRSPDGTIREFKKGGFVTAVEKRLPILPVTVNGSRKVLPKHRLVYRSGKIEVVVAKPIETTGYTPETIDGLVEKTRNTIIANFNPDYPDTGK